MFYDCLRCGYSTHYEGNDGPGEHCQNLNDAEAAKLLSERHQRVQERIRLRKMRLINGRSPW